ncbi:4a-hydroxytetrahydrobiopterin dehydratase [Candidatus Nanohaloarchaea archaeon]|nr:4a-hydroxytetrahydrobiopterin dehydratase [Candidatus Nanohaloarchaea archaeon]
MSDKLDDSEINERLEELEIWGIEAEKLVCRVEFDDYKKSVFFANSVFSLAEEEFHHPSVTVEYGAVEIDLWSHDVEGLTERDFDLAERIEDKVRNIDWD